MNEENKCLMYEPLCGVEGVSHAQNFNYEKWQFLWV
jgi:hypothetical protein